MILAEIKDNNNDDNIQRDPENESTPLKPLTVKNKTKKNKEKKTGAIPTKFKLNFNLIILFTIIIIMILFFLYQYITNLNSDKPLQEKKISNLRRNNSNAFANSNTSIFNNTHTNKNISLESLPKNKNENQKINNNNNITSTNNNVVVNLNKKDIQIKERPKPGVAFIYHILHSNGVARVVALTADYLIKTGKYNVYLITGKSYSKDYKYDSRIKRFIGHENRTLIKELKTQLNIEYFILNNQLTESLIKFLQSLNTKVIGIFHGVYLSAIFHNNTQAYRGWYKFGFYNAFIAVTADDLYFYKKLGYRNAIFIPNLYTFEPDETPESNLTYNNIIMLGRAHDMIKGTKFALKAMTYIIKEVPDAILTFASSDSKIQDLENLAKNLNISKNINFQIFPNITKVFLNSSVLLFTSLCEAFPMAMNEGKAHGLPIVAFNIPFSPPYQSGVITVPHLDVMALAKETIKLLKDYNYRKRMGKESKLSLKRFTNQGTVKLWEELFDSLDKGVNEYRKFQTKIDDMYYNEEKAKEHVLMHYNSALKFNKYFRCHKLEDMLKLNYIKNIKNCTNVT